MQRGLENLQHEPIFSEQRDHLMIRLLYETGMRRAELINLKVNSFQQGRGELRVIGKGNKECIIPISKDLAGSVREYIRLRNIEFPEAPFELLLTDKGAKMYPKYVYNKVKKWITANSSVDKRSPHILRHSIATHLADGGAELNAIKELLGHASLAATQIYTHNSIERLRNIYAQAHPKGA